MRDGKQFKVGDKIVEFGKVFRIFKVKKQENAEGKKERLIFFRPYFKDKKDNSIIYSIPSKGIRKTNIRRPLTKRELRKLFKKLSKKTAVKNPVNVGQAKEVLNSNNPDEIVEVIRRLWAEKSNQSTNFTMSKKEAFKLSIKRLVEETAYIERLSLKNARKKIKGTLPEASS
jgi:RNA polymerase-interacting CarD/CdnL/TRCF family regulator